MRISRPISTVLESIPSLFLCSVDSLFGPSVMSGIALIAIWRSWFAILGNMCRFIGNASLVSQIGWRHFHRHPIAAEGQPGDVAAPWLPPGPWVHNQICLGGL